MVTFRGILPGVNFWRSCKEIELDKLDPTSAQDVFLRLSDIQEQSLYPHLDDILAAVEYLPLAIVLLASQATREFRSRAALGGMEAASFGDVERQSISAGDAELTRLECACLH